VSDTPEVGTIADGRSLGHVAWVVGVSKDKLTITVSEMKCGEFCGDYSNPANPSESVGTGVYSASRFEYIYPLEITNQYISTTFCSTRR
jgi:surface antigen